MPNPSSLRERKKQATRLALLEVANRLFHERGFDETTLEEICEGAEISKRTFFRYFASKEDLVFPNRELRLSQFKALLADPAPGESAFEVLRRSSRALAVGYMLHREHLLAQQTVIRTSSALQAKEQEIDRVWEQAMVEFFARSGFSELGARVISGATIGVVRATMRHWYASGGKGDLVQLGDEALDCLERGFLPE